MIMEMHSEYTHESLEELGKEISDLRALARQLDEGVASGAISREEYASAASVLLSRKKQIEAILADVNRYISDVCDEIGEERRLRLAAEERIAALEANKGVSKRV
jgi:predicted translin family RNA/ssDNA-binding protein